jgi:hypothetical protein
MNNKSRRNCWEAPLLAAALAVVGTLFSFDKLGSLVRNSNLSFEAILHTAPVLVIVLGVGLLLAEQISAPHKSSVKEARHE